MASDDDTLKCAGMGCMGCCVILVFITLIVILTNIYNLGPEDQVVIVHRNDRETVNGPANKLLNPFKEKIQRKATRLGPRDYAVIKNRRGLLRHEEGPQLLFLDGWDEVQGVKQKTVLQRMDYLRLFDRRTGFERVVRGPVLLTPGVYEYAPNGTKQAIVISPSSSVVVFNRTNGFRTLIMTPGIFAPGPYEEILEERQAIVISRLQYLIVKNIKTSLQEIVAGGEVNGDTTDDGRRYHVKEWEVINCTALTAPFAQLEYPCLRDKIVLQLGEYVRFVSARSGEQRVVRGPGVAVPDVTEYFTGISQSEFVTVTTRLVVQNNTARWVYPPTDGQYQDAALPGQYTPGPYEKINMTYQADLIEKSQYAVVTLANGRKVHIEGPQLLRRGPLDTLKSIEDKVLLKKDQYVKLKDFKTGVIRVVKGPQSVVPTPSEANPECRDTTSCVLKPKVEYAVFLNTDQAVLIEDRSNLGSGTANTGGTVDLQQLKTAEDISNGASSAVFWPQGLETIVEIRKKNRVLPYEAHYYKKKDEARAQVMLPRDKGGAGSYFLPAYATVTPLRWSECDLYCVKRSYTVIDLRAKQLFITHPNITTKDQFQLELKGSAFWQIEDAEALMGVNNVEDPVEVVWNKVKASILGVAQLMTFQEIKENITNVSVQVEENIRTGGAATEFALFGARVHNFEMSAYRVLKKEQEQQMQTAVQQKVTGIKKRKQTENEAELEKQGREFTKKIELEKQKLLDIQAENSALQSKGLGEAEGELRVAGAAEFLEGLRETVNDETKRVHLYQLRENINVRNKNTADVASMGATLFGRPEDFSFNIGSNYSGP